MGHLTQKLPDKQQQITNRQAQMRLAVPDWEVSEDGIAAIGRSLQLPDKDDRHVLAAAIVDRADLAFRRRP